MNPHVLPRWLFAVGVGLTALGCQQPAANSHPVAESVAETAVESLGSEPPKDEPATGAASHRTVYVPAYSHLPKGTEGDGRSLLSVLLSVRNVDLSTAITLTHVDYYDTAGKRVRRYLSQPRTLKALETAEFAVDTLDEAGGSGANFLVHWEGPSDAQPLLTEAVMVGHLGAGYVSFTSRGIDLARRSVTHAAQ